MPNRTPSQRGRASRRKGHNYERRIAAWYREHGHAKAQRGWQSRDGHEQADVCVPGYSIEAKCAARQMNIPDAMKQAADCAKDGDLCLVHFKVDRRGEYVVVRLEDWPAFLEGTK